MACWNKLLHNMTYMDHTEKNYDGKTPKSFTGCRNKNNKRCKIKKKDVNDPKGHNLKDAKQQQKS